MRFFLHDHYTKLTKLQGVGIGTVMLHFFMEYIFHLQIKYWYLSIDGLNLDENTTSGWNFRRN